MRTEVSVVLAAVLVSAPIVGAVGPLDDEDVGPDDGVPMGAHGDDHPPIRIHGDEQFLLPSSGVTGGSGTADDPYVISGWTVRPEYVMWDFAGNDPEDDELVAEKCKPSPVAQWEVLGAKARFHGIEIVDTSAHVVIENVTVRPRDPTVGPADRFRWDSSVSIGILLRDVDHVTIRNVTVGQADGPRLYRGICAKNSDDLRIQNSTVQRTVGDGVQVHNAVGVTVADTDVVDSSGGGGTTFGVGVDLESVDDVSLAGNRVWTHADLVVDVGSGSNVAIVGNTIGNGTFGGIDVGGVDDMTIRNNAIRDNGHDGIDIHGSSNIEIRGNNIENNARTGLDFGDIHLDVTGNWWGDDSGPSGGVTDNCKGTTADGDGDAIELDSGATVCFDPWLTSANDDAGA